MKDLSRRIMISLTLAGIIMGGMSVSLAHLPSAPSAKNEIVQVSKE